MLRFIRAALLPLLLFTVPAAAQTTAAPPQQPQVDPRIAGPTIEAQAALLKLREAEIRALAQDSDTRVKDLEAKLKAAQEVAQDAAERAIPAPAPAPAPVEQPAKE